MTVFSPVARIQACPAQVSMARTWAVMQRDYAAQNALERFLDALMVPMGVAGLACSAGFPATLVAVAATVPRGRDSDGVSL